MICKIFLWSWLLHLPGCCKLLRHELKSSWTHVFVVLCYCCYGFKTCTTRANSQQYTVLPRRRKPHLARDTNIGIDCLPILSLGIIHSHQQHRSRFFVCPRNHLARHTTRKRRFDQKTVLQQGMVCKSRDRRLKTCTKLQDLMNWENAL